MKTVQGGCHRMIDKDGQQKCKYENIERRENEKIEFLNECVVIIEYEFVKLES